MSDLATPARPSLIKRSFNGCWTCRVRRKKCDEKRPVCDACAALHITCTYVPDKPAWMDGGAKQQEMAEQLKREVKDNAHLRTSDREARFVEAGSNANTANAIASTARRDLASFSNTGKDRYDPALEHNHAWQSGFDGQLAGNHTAGSEVLEQSDSIILLFYLEHVLPFMFPFYAPAVLQGGKAWVLQMVTSSPVFRQTILCQASYFFSLLREAVPHDIIWNTRLEQSKGIFEALKQALQANSNVRENLPSTVRTLTSMVQVQRFEIAVSRFDNCQAHLNAAVSLFEQILLSQQSDCKQKFEPRTLFCTVMDHLGSSPSIFSDGIASIPSAEQAALSFSTALLICDDIVASIVLQEEPRLYNYHRELLEKLDGDEPLIDLESVTGCQNWVMVEMAETAALDAWKNRCKRAGNLDMMELVRRATVIKTAMEANVANPPTRPLFRPLDTKDLLHIFTSKHYQQSGPSIEHRALATSIWAHAAFLYLSVVVSGWQTAGPDIRYHVDRIVELFSDPTLPPEILRSMVWPFCVAGCLAEPSQELRFRVMVETLQPSSVFGSVRQALDVMKSVWKNRSPQDAATRDLAACFKGQGGGLVLLV